MNLKNIRQLAKTLKIEPGHLSKPELIWQIQLAEGNFDCYASAQSGECDQLDCTWRTDCLSGSQATAPEAS
ncbi:MAG: hypothetical protein RLZZ371_2709 [Pseudomonadota bacterium]|jgi:hypothetical protein